MDRDAVIALLKQHKPALAERFGVTALTSNAMQSMSDRDGGLYLEDMLESCDRALRYVRGVGRQPLDADQMR